MKSSGDRLIRLIAVFKLFKAGLMVAVGIGAFRLLHRDLGETLEHWVEALKLDPGHKFLETALGRVSHVSPRQIRNLGVGSFIYAALFFTEGVGLWLGKRWAEWLTVIITSSLVPIEVYEIHRHPTAVKGLVLAVNVVIVVYLMFHIRRQRA